MSLWMKSELENLFICSLPNDFECHGVSIDTRTLKKGDIFLAVTGPNFDGHLFAKTAEAKGASAIIATRPLPEVSCPVIIVESILTALCSMARTARARTKGRVVAITGSVGKTTAKEFIHQVLSQFGSAYCVPESYNNHWGVPLTLSRVPRETQYVIVEIGMNHAGEIAPLCEMVRPHVAIITSIASAHIGNMGSLDEIAKEKASIFVGLEPEGVAVIPADISFHDYLKSMALKRFPRHVYSFGETAKAGIRLHGYEALTDFTSRAKVNIGDTTIPFKLPTSGKHMALNALTVFAVASAFRLNLTKVGKALEKITTMKGRCQIHRVDIAKGDQSFPITLIDDSYNANSYSMKAGIDVLDTIRQQKGGRSIAVLGEMLELGSYALSEHQEIASYCQEKNVDVVFACGGVPISQAFSSGEKQTHSYQIKAEDLIPIVLDALQPNDVVFVKGSKGSKVSLVADALLAAAKSGLDSSQKQG